MQSTHKNSEMSAKHDDVMSSFAIISVSSPRDTICRGCVMVSKMWIQQIRTKKAATCFTYEFFAVTCHFMIRPAINMDLAYIDVIERYTASLNEFSKLRC